MTYRCPHCATETVYQMFSGGREWYCPGCEANGDYPAEGEGLPRATLLQTEEGRIALRAQMDQEIARRAAQETDPVQHNHRERVEGCFRCDLSAQETDPG